jgi:hypothetical protein
MNTKFTDMTNAELKQACMDFGLEVNAKNSIKPTKAEYVEVLEKFKATQDSIHGIDREEEDKKEEVKETKKASGSKRKPQSRIKLMRLDLFKKDRVIVHDQQERQTKDEMISVSWGNRAIGGQTDWVHLSGEPQYVRRGALNNLREATTVVHIPKPGGGVSMERRKRFVVVEVDPLTPEELAELANKQKLRNAKYA